jgi:hypothetical protein
VSRNSRLILIIGNKYITFANSKSKTHCGR